MNNGFSVISTQSRDVTDNLAFPCFMLMQSFSAPARRELHNELKRVSDETLSYAQSNVTKPHLHSQPFLIQPLNGGIN